MNTKVRKAMAAAGALALWLGPVEGVWAQETPAREAPRHEVRRGETLWGLAGRYLANPFRWPEIFQLNPDVVQDPHWIYPGEQLRIPGSGVIPVSDVARDRSTAAAYRASRGRPSGSPDLSGTVFATRSDKILSSSGLEVDSMARLSIVSESDFYRADLLIVPSELGPSGTTSSVVEENPLGLNLPPSVRLNQEVVLHLDDLTVSEGDFVQAVRWGRSVGGQGSVLESKAMLRITSTAGDSARAVVVDLYGDYQVGDLVVAAADFFLDPDFTVEETDTRLEGSIVAFAVETQEILGLYDEVFLDVGRRAGVQLGDEFLVFSARETAPETADAADALCRLRVVRVTDGTATAVLYEVRDAGTRPGNPVRLAGRVAG